MELNPYKIGIGGVFVAVILSGVLPKMMAGGRGPTQAEVVQAPVVAPPPKPVVTEAAAPTPTPAYLMIQGGPKLPSLVDGVTLNGKPIAADTQPPSLRETIGDDAYEQLRQSRN